MATVPSPKTWAAGEKLTASELNLELRDALAFLLDPPSAYAYKTSDQNITTGITNWTTVTFQAELYDNDGIHSNVTNNSRMTCQTAGTYLIGASITWATETTNANRGLRLVLNGTDTLSTIRYRNSNVNTTGQEIHVRVELTVGDYVTLEVAQDSGSTVALNSTTSGTTFLWVKWDGS